MYLLSLFVSNNSGWLDFTCLGEEFFNWVWVGVVRKSTDEQSRGGDFGVGFDRSLLSLLTELVSSSAWHGLSAGGGLSSGLFNLEGSAHVFGSWKLEGIVKSRSFVELDESESFWLSIGSHEDVNVDDFSTFLENGSDVGFVSVEWKTLNADFELSFFIFLFGLLLLFIDDFDWLDFDWFLLFLWLFNLFDCLFSGLGLGLDLLFTLLLLAFLLDWLFGNFLSWGLGLLKGWLGSFFGWLDFLLGLFWALLNDLLSLDGLHNGWFGLLEGWFCGLLGWFDFFLLAFFAWFFNLLLSNWLDLLGWDDLLGWFLLFRAFLTWLLDFLLWDNSLLGWGFGLDWLLNDFLFLALFWRWRLFGFFGCSIFGLDCLHWFCLDLLGLLIHGDLGGLSGWLGGFRLDDGGVFFFTWFLNLRFLFGLFLGIDLLFLWYNQRKWAWWVFFWVLGYKNGLLRWLAF